MPQPMKLWVGKVVVVVVVDGDRIGCLDVTARGESVMDELH